MPHRAFIGIGTNLGDRLANYHEALERIGKLRQTRIVRQSSIYETEPVGDVIGPFLNGAVEVETELSAEVLMQQLLSIERAMGRKRVRMPKGAARAKYKPRIIDLDLLFFNNELIDSPKLTGAPSPAPGKALRAGADERTGARFDSSAPQCQYFGIACRTEIHPESCVDARRFA